MQKPIANWSIAGALGAAVAASACCTIPFMLVSIGIGGAWVSTLIAFQPYRPIFVAMALGLLAFAFYRRHKVVKEPDCDCISGKSYRTNSGLMIVGVLATLALIFSPYFIPNGSQENSGTIIVNSEDVIEVLLDIEGMTCASCTATVEKALSRLTGVVKTRVTYEPAQAVVQYDTSRLSEADLTDATAIAGYPSHVIQRDMQAIR